MEVVLVRHGETEWSASGKHTSSTDLDLTPAGRERAVAVGRQLAGRSFELVLCSPLLRAVETCRLAGFGDAAVLCEDLREWDYGDYEGLTTPEIRSRNPSWQLWRDGCPGGELPDEVGARADRVLRRVREVGEGEAIVPGGDGGDALVPGAAARGRGVDAIVPGAAAIAFAHGHILRVIAARWIGLPAAGGARLALSAGAISVLGFERETEVLERWNT